MLLNCIHKQDIPILATGDIKLCGMTNLMAVYKSACCGNMLDLNRIVQIN
jgi:hypothetical protein